MSIKGLMTSIIAAFRSPPGRVALLAAYYIAILLLLILLYGKGDFGATDFVYQGF
jgi:hypothetical protein